MSRLSELLNPAPSSEGGPTPMPAPIDPHSANAELNNRHQSISSPLEALALAASTGEPVTSPSNPHFAFPSHHQSSAPLVSSRPTSSHAQLSMSDKYPESRAEKMQPGSAEPSHATQEARQPSEMAHEPSQELPPFLQRALREGRQPKPVSGDVTSHASLAKQSDRTDSMETTDKMDEAHDGASEAALQDSEQSGSRSHRISEAGLSAKIDGATSPPVNKPGKKSEAINLAGEAGQDGTDRAGSGETLHNQIINDNTATASMVIQKSDDRLKGVESMTDAAVPVQEASSTNRPPPSKKRPAPKSDKKVEKKGTASAVKKPAPKKRKIETDSPGGTPFSQRSVTPTSSRASKTPAPRNRKASATPLRSSPFPTSSDVNDSDEGNDLFCICRRPDDHTWMIGCDGGCEDWFHGKCVDIDERDGNLIDKYICPNCGEKGIGQTTWKPMCRLETCRDPARIAGKKPSKYCSDEHGAEFMRLRALGKEGRNAERERKNGASANKKRRRQNFTDNIENTTDDVIASPANDEDAETHLSGGVLRATELKALASGVKDVAEFRKLGEGVSRPPDADNNVMIYTSEEASQLSGITEKQEILRNRREALDDRERFLDLVKSRARNILEEVKKKEKAIKDICGYDARLSWSDEEFEAWRLSIEGRQALETGVLCPSSNTNITETEVVRGNDDSDTSMVNGTAENGTEEEGDEIGLGVCQRKRCDRHKTWYKIQQQEIAFEKDASRQAERKLDNEEKGVKERAMVRYLEGRNDDNIDGKLGTGKGNQLDGYGLASHGLHTIDIDVKGHGRAPKGQQEEDRLMRMEG